MREASSSALQERASDLLLHVFFISGSTAWGLLKLQLVLGLEVRFQVVIVEDASGSEGVPELTVQNI